RSGPVWLGRGRAGPVRSGMAVTVRVPVLPGGPVLPRRPVLSGNAVAGGRRGQVDPGVTVEEAERLQGEPRVLARHDWEVLRPAEMGDAYRVPEHDIGV